MSLMLPFIYLQLVLGQHAPKALQGERPLQHPSLAGPGRQQLSVRALSVADGLHKQATYEHPATYTQAATGATVARCDRPPVTWSSSGRSTAAAQYSVTVTECDTQCTTQLSGFAH